MFRWFSDSLGMATSEVVFFLVFLLGLVVSIGGWVFGGGDHGDDHGGDHGGDHGDHGGDHGAPHIELSSFFSIRAMSLFITGFGAAGYAVMHIWQKLYLACAAGFLSGVGLAALGLWMIHFVMKQQSDSTITAADTVGHEALVVTDVPGALAGKGEVSFVAGGVQQHSPAMTEDAGGFRRGATVRIVRSGPTFLLVERATGGNPAGGVS